MFAGISGLLGGRRVAGVLELGNTSLRGFEPALVVVFALALVLGFAFVCVFVLGLPLVAVFFGLAMI
jgi:hypothetical protein